MTPLNSDFKAEYDRIFSLWIDDAMTGLKPAERDFITANVCLNESGNGGLMQYYENSYGENAHEAVDVFRRISQPKAADLLTKANSLMGPKGPAKEQEERGDQLAALSDAALDKMAQCSDALNDLSAQVRAATLAWVRKFAR
ncbi:MAG: DUF4375 domain-containing protein [Planctomycetota bacterium]|nr:DUF4375 domain-containing protein [Planctomycetota bacterium]